MNVWTKRGVDIVAPTDAAGNPRKVVNGEMQTWMTEVERLFNTGAFNSVDAVGLYADRSTFDGEAEGFVYVSIDGDGAGSSSAVVFIKESAASGDWSPPVPFQGDKGWSPLFRVVSDGARRLLEVYDWIGGDGEKPDLIGYIGAAGITANIAEAIDVRGSQGVAGTGLSWNFDDGTADADPGAGNLRADAADLSAATELFVSKTSAGGDPVASFLAGLTNSTSTHKGYLIVTDPSTASQATFDVTGTTDAAGYVKLAVSGHSGALAFDDATLLSVVFSRTGNAGDLNGINPGPAGLAVLGAETPDAARGVLGIADYATRSEAMAATIIASQDYVRTAGYASVGDGGGALFKRAVSEPTHEGKFQSADGAWWEIEESILFPEQFGAMSGGAQVDVRAGLDRLKTTSSALGVKWVLRKHYNIGTAGTPFSLENCLGMVGAEITGNVYLGPVTGVQGEPIKVHFNNGSIFFDYVVDPAALSKPTEKDTFLTAGDVLNAKYSAVDMSTIETSYWEAGTGDNFVPETPATKIADTIGWSLAGSTGRWHVAWCPVTGGDEVSAAFSRGEFIRGIFVLTTSGIEYLYAQPDGTSGTFGIKAPGTAPSENAYSIPGAAGNIAYRFRNAELTARLKSPNRYSILANGSEIVEVRRTYYGGEVLAFGFAVFENGTHAPTLKNMVKARKSEQHGLSPLTVAILGNSISGDNVFGRWDVWLRKYLDMSMGVRVTNLVNVAVSGVGSAGILDQSTDPLIAPAHCVLICAPGTNDTQFTVPVATTVSNISAAIDNISNAGKKPILMIEPMWYTPAMAGGQGQASQNHELGAERRTALRRLAAQKGIPCVDMQQISGFIDPSWVTQQDVIDPTLRDNIHPSALFFKAIAHAAARAVLEAYAPQPGRMVKDKLIPATGAYSWLGAEFSVGARAPRYSLTEDGVVTLSGIVSHDAASSPATILKLPAALRPEYTQDVMTSMFNGGANSPIYLTIGESGDIEVYSSPSGSLVRLDGISWHIRG